MCQRSFTVFIQRRWRSIWFHRAQGHLIFIIEDVASNKQVRRNKWVFCYGSKQSYQPYITSSNIQQILNSGDWHMGIIPVTNGNKLIIVNGYHYLNATNVFRFFVALLKVGYNYIFFWWIYGVANRITCIMNIGIWGQWFIYFYLYSKWPLLRNYSSRCTVWQHVIYL